MRKFIKAKVLNTDTHQAYIREDIPLEVLTFDEVIRDAVVELSIVGIVSFVETAPAVFDQLRVFLRSLTGIVYIELEEENDKKEG